MFCLNNYNIYVMTAHNSLYIKVRINRRIVYFINDISDSKSYTAYEQNSRALTVS